MTSSSQNSEAGRDQLLVFFKALADANRLKILGLLAQDELTVAELAELLDLQPSTISHHLSRLAQAGLVSARAESYYHMYRLETDALEDMARQMLSVEQLSAASTEVDLSAYDRKVWQDYLTKDGHLKEIPAQRKKLDAVLRRLIQDFEPGETYTEKEVNQILGRYHKDTASLRREMVGSQLLDRDPKGERYWRTQEK
ncbi:MAG: metalloregulator ArsR/SmtB family transcription factor [Anaerolineales bacterium]